MFFNYWVISTELQAPHLLYLLNMLKGCINFVSENAWIIMITWYHFISEKKNMTQDCTLCTPTVKPLLREPPRKQPPSSDRPENLAVAGHLTCKLTSFERSPDLKGNFSGGIWSEFSKEVSLYIQHNTLYLHMMCKLSVQSCSYSVNQIVASQSSAIFSRTWFST